ncbi:MAG: AAA family ATPase [Actinomycetota bacterium]|nr:AAA family ATPase [Actinomycetota bacterium]
MNPANRHLPAAEDAGRLHERGDSLATIEEVLACASVGSGAVLALVGESGLGKTTLLELAITRARARGFAIGAARGDSAESSLPFGLLQQAASSLGDSGRFADLAASSPAEPNARRFYATTTWLHQRAAEHPLLLAIDDLHWADPDSLALIGFLCRRVEQLPVALVLTSRPWPQEASELLGRLHGSGTAHLEVLTPLSHRAAASVLKERLGGTPEPATAQQAWSLCAGNPLLLEQVAHAVREGTPIPEGSSAALRARFLLGRFAGVPANAYRYAQMASVFGTDFRLSVLPSAAELTESQADTALTALSHSGLVSGERPGWAKFCHPLLCQAIYDDIAPPLRAHLHARAFEALLAVDAAAGESASHALRAGLAGDRRAVAVLSRAGRDAVRAGATASGRTHLVGAVELAGEAADPTLLLSLAEAYMSTGDLTGADKLGGEVLAVADLDRATSIQAHWVVARAAMFLGREARAWEHFQTGAELACESNPDLAANVLLYAAMMWWMSRGPRRCLEAAARARELAQSSQVRREAAAVWAQAALMMSEPGGLDALKSAGRLTAGSATRALPDFLISGAPLLAWLLGARMVERFDQAQPAFAVGHAAAERAGSPLVMGLCLVAHADTLTRLGRLTEALELLDRADRLADFSLAIGPWAAVGRAYVLLEQGRPAQSRAQCTAVERVLAALPDRFPLLALWVWRILADLHLAEGDVAEACELLERLEDRARVSGIVEPCVVPWHAVAVRANLAAGRFDKVARLADALEQSVSTLPCRWPRAVAVGARALVAEHGGDRSAARQHFEGALVLLEHAPLPLAGAELRLAFGAFLRRGGERQAARAMLRSALQAAQSAGAGRWQAAAEQELRVAGARRRGVSEGLTVQEQRVAALAAEGLSNKELAARLSITPKTVSNHLEHIYQKLGIHGRRELMRKPADLR